MFFNYKGTSMNPTLKPGACLKVTQYKLKKICAGDVVIFRAMEGNHYVVHRVASVDSQGIRTRGDNNPDLDSRILHLEDIIGRVVLIKNKKKNIQVYGGGRGRIFAFALRVKRPIKLTLFRALRPYYQIFPKSIICRPFLTHWIKTKVICFKRPKGIEMQLLWGPQVIGRRLPGKTKWRIRCPFSLFVDSTSLPDT